MPTDSSPHAELIEHAEKTAHAPLGVEAARRKIAAALHVPVDVITRQKIYRMVWDGRIASFRFGNSILIPPEALDDFIARCIAGERY